MFTYADFRWFQVYACDPASTFAWATCYRVQLPVSGGLTDDRAGYWEHELVSLIAETLDPHIYVQGCSTPDSRPWAE